MLFDIRKSLTTALQEGWSGQRWAKEITPTLKQKGWWESEVIIDEDGKARVYQKGNASRLDLIFRQNVMTAYAAGRWQRQQETKKERPYLRYSAIMDGRTRRRTAPWTALFFLWMIRSGRHSIPRTDSAAAARWFPFPVGKLPPGKSNTATGP